MIHTEKAHAKLNLHLEVLGKREDGFHDIYSILVKTELHDVLGLVESDIKKGTGAVETEIVAVDSSFSSLLDEIPLNENLIHIASEKYLSILGYEGRAVFQIEKNIPAGGGLGGGSSDAAAAIKLLSKKLERSLDSFAFSASENTGSDVPFFLTDSAAIAESRGEILTPLNFTACGFILLVNTGISVNTGRAYASLGRPVGEPAKPVEGLKEALEPALHDVLLWKDFFYNDFEKSVFIQYPVLSEVKSRILSGGALFSMMTGSGSTIFGIFSDEQSAYSVKMLFEDMGYWTAVTKFN